jgi:putative hemolysin
MTDTTLSSIQPATDASDFSFTYCQPNFSLSRRTIIRAIERLTGQPKLERLYRLWSKNPVSDETIFAAAMRLLQLDVKTDFGKWRMIPKAGPVLIIANHPFGVLDGLTIGYLSTLARRDVKIMTHSLLCQPKEVQPFMLPVDFSGTAEAQYRTIQTRRNAVNWLKEGHVVVVFPAGGVSTTVTPFSKHAVDSEWHPFIAKLARVKELTIVPVFFAGQNSRLFQIVSHFSYPLRLALLFRESIKRTRNSIEVKIGEFVKSSELPHGEDRTAMMRQLRKLTYELAGTSGPDWQLEFVFPRHISFN